MFCKECDFYKSDTWDGGWGSCKNDKVSDGCWGNTKTLIQGGGDEGYGDYIKMKPDFGCILFKKDKP